MAIGAKMRKISLLLLLLLVFLGVSINAQKRTARRNRSPITNPSASPTSGVAPLSVQFMANASDPDGSIVSYSWMFGDGGVSSIANPLHVYNTQGSYQASILVTDNKGATATGFVSIIVSTQSQGGNIRYVIPTGGSNTGDCTSTACTIARAISQAVAGDTIEMAAGTYTGAFGDSGIMDWYGKNGTQTNPIKVQPAAGANVVIKPDAPTYRAILFRNCSWIELHNLVIDGTNLTAEAVKCTTTTNGATDILIENCEIKNAHSMGVLTSDDLTARLTLRNCFIHNNGTNIDLDHNVYLATAGNIVENCEISFGASYGIHLYGSDTMNNNIFRNNVIHDNNAAGIGIFGGDGNLAYNNIIYHNTLGIRVRSYAVIGIVGIYNNTIEDSYTTPNGGGVGILGEISFAFTALNVQNNIVSNSSVLAESYAAGLGGTRNHQLISNTPNYVNPSIHDYHLNIGSLAIDAGIDLSSFFINDKDFVSRPQGVAWDIGAYER